MQQEVVAVENGIEAPAQDAAVANGDQLRSAGGDDVEPFVDATAAARRVVLADRPTRAVGALNREDVAVVRRPALLGGNASAGGCGQSEKKSEGEKGGARQWCSMTRSTMLYSLASSALMK